MTLSPGEAESTGPTGLTRPTGSIGGYTLTDRLGSGGMGVVYLGRSASGRQVAVKVVHPQYAQDEEFRARFRQEVAAARRVSGAFTAPVVDADPDAEVPWMATLYVPGRTLTEVLETDGPLAGRELRTLALGLVEALRDIHQAGLVHRDLKPSNVLMAADGPRVIDFGISRAADNQALTVTGRLIGTPPFMSPEQFAAPRDVTAASDVFSLGSLLVYAATGTGPFSADSPYMTGYQVMHEPPGLDGVPEPLRSIAERCLEKDAAARPQLAELHRMLQTLPDSAAPAAPTAPGAGAFADSHDFTVVTGSTNSRHRKAGSRSRPGPPGGTVTRATGGRAGTPAGRERRGRRGRRGRQILVGLAAALAVTGLSLTAVHFTASRSTPSPSGPAPSSTTGSRTAVLPAGWRPWRTTLARAAKGDEFSTQSWCVTGGGNDLYCGGTNFTVAGIDTASGRVRWQPRTVSPQVLPVGVQDGLVYVYELPDLSEEVTRLVAVDAETGQERWTRTVGGGADPAYLFSGGVLAMSADQREFVAYGPSGDELWRSPASAPAGATCIPVVLGGGPYALCAPEDDDTVTSYDVLRLDPSDGTRSELARLSLPAEPLGVVGGQLLFAAQRDPRESQDGTVSEDAAYEELLRVDPRSGATERVPLAESPSGTATLVGGVVYFVREDGTVTAVSAADGTRLWQHATETEDLTEPVVSTTYGTVYVANRFGRLVALDSATGAERWRTAGLDDPGDTTLDPQVVLVKDMIVTVAGSTAFSVSPDRPTARPTPVTATD